MENKEYFDEPASDGYIKSIVALYGQLGENIHERFTKKQSKDFYLGMIAFERVALSFLNRFSGDDLMIAITKLGMYAALIANDKINEQENTKVK